MNWIKQGHIYAPSGMLDWMYHYAAQVCPVEFSDFIRVYFTTRSKLNDEGNYETKITFVDCDKNDPGKVIYVHDLPLLSLGTPGTFDEHGTMACEIIFHNNTYWLYYIGWQRSTTVPYINTIGLATSKDGINFNKVSEGPIIGVSKDNPYGVAKSSILIENGMFHMWYGHYTPWIQSENSFKPTYNIRYATSLDGISWEFKNICIPSSKNKAVATPCVRKINDIYHMWYGYRAEVDENGKSGPYKIGYATSFDKINWDLEKDQIDISETGWDSEMICYPNILKLKDQMLLFYSGNNYGKTGFGYAKTNLK